MNTPNKLTVLRILMIPLFLLVLSLPLSFGELHLFQAKLPLVRLIAAVIFILAAITDWLDGYLARKMNLVTNFGKFADPLADKMLVMSAFIVLVAMGEVPSWVVAVIVMRELAVTGLRLVLVEQGEVLAADFFGKVKTVTQMLAIIFLLIGNLPFSVINFPMDRIFIYVALFFTVYSGIDYFWKNRSVFFDSF